MDDKPLKATEYSKVYRATKNNDKKEYIIKFVNLAYVRDDELTQYISLINSLNQLGHNNIVRYHELYSDDEFLWLVTEFYKGKTLFERLTVLKDKFTEFEAATVIEKLLHVIKKLHNRKNP